MDKVQRIIEILNNKRDGTVHGAFMGEIADELATLRAENERMRGALESIANGYGIYGAQAWEYKRIALEALK